jgi:hypothetical protein
VGRVGVTASRRISKARRANAMKWRYRIAQGFYEVDLVKTARLKSIF